MSRSLAVIGGGPAGLCAALEGARHGLNVVLFEKNRIGEDIRCAEGFFDTLKLLRKPEAGVRFKVEEVIIELKYRYTVDVRSLNIWMIDRREWQLYLAERAKAAGVDIREREKVLPERIATLQEDFDWVIDASGPRPVTRRNRRRRAQSYALALQYEMEGDFSFIGNRLKAVIERHYQGYYWVFPKGKGPGGIETANVGIGWFNPPKGRGEKLNLKSELNRILLKEGLENYRVVRKCGGLIPLVPVQPMVAGNIILVGDAAGLVSPLHGGGIDMACYSGQLAATCIAQGLGGQYEKILWERVGRKLSLEYKLHKLWGRVGLDFMDHILSIMLNKAKTLDFETLLKFYNSFVANKGLLGLFTR